MENGMHVALAFSENDERRSAEISVPKSPLDLISNWCHLWSRKDRFGRLGMPRISPWKVAVRVPAAVAGWGISLPGEIRLSGKYSLLILHGRGIRFSDRLTVPHSSSAGQSDSPTPGGLSARLECRPCR